MTSQTLSAPAGFVRVWARFIKRHPVGGISSVLLAILVLVVALAGLIAPHPFDVTVARPFLGFGTHASNGSRLWLGSDDLGRDELSRLIFGGRASLLIGVMAPLLGVLVGTVVGAASAYWGGVTDLIGQRLVDMMLMLPGLVVALAITVALGFTIPVVIVALSIGMMGGTSRVVRARALSLSHSEFVDAARAMGAPNWFILVRHILPNLVPLAIVLFTVHIGTAIAAAAGLSYLGMGVQPPTPSWGNMLGGARDFFSVAPQLALLPGIVISIVVLFLNLFGDALRDVLDPRLRGII